MSNLYVTQTVNGDLQPVKVNGESSALEIAQDEVKVKSLEIDGTGICRTPTVNNQIANKAYVDSAGGGAVTALNSATENELVTVGSTTTELDAESNLTYNGTTFGVQGLATIRSTTPDQLSVLYDASNYAHLNVSSSGDLEIETVGAGTTDSDLTLNIDGSIILNSADGGFEIKNAGTKFADMYAGMILGYTDIGLNETAATYNLTTSYAVPTSEFKVSFVVPPSENVEIQIQVECDVGTSNSGDLYAGLSDASSYNAVASYHEVELFDGMSRGALRNITHSWTLTADTLPAIGTTEELWVGFKTSSTLGTPHLQYGGDATGEYPDFIIKAIALPATIST